MAGIRADDGPWLEKTVEFLFSVQKALSRKQQEQKNSQKNRTQALDFKYVYAGNME